MYVINYAASVAFAVLAIALIFTYGIMTGDHTAARLSVVAAAMAWASCYIGQIEGEKYQHVATGITVLVVLLVLFLLVRIAGAT